MQHARSISDCQPSAPDELPVLISQAAQVSPLIAVVGATGTGKSELSLSLAEALATSGVSAEIVGADAMQLYRGMDIGTAKLPSSERRGIPHHLIDVLEPHEEAIVAEYQDRARAAFDAIERRDAVPILVGGSGLYVNSALYHFDFPGADPVIRSELNARFDADGLAPLVEELLERDPEAATTVDFKNPRRVIRALEVLRVTGRPIASALPERPSPIRPTMVIRVHEERAALVERLDRRVERMWEDGLLAEVRALIPRGITEGPTAAHAIGYAQALGQLSGEKTESEAIEETQALTRRYARRQVSWFKRLETHHLVLSREIGDGATVDRLVQAWMNHVH